MKPPVSSPNECRWQSQLMLSEGPVHCLDWSKSSVSGQRPRSAFRLGIASLVEGYNNRIAVIGLQDERVLVEDDYTEYPDFVTLCDTAHGYPATNLQWQPASVHNWGQNSSSTELLAATGDALRVYEYNSDAPPTSSTYVGRQSSNSGHTLTTKTALSGVSLSHSSNIEGLIHYFFAAIQGPVTIYRGTVDQLFMEWEIS